MRATCRNTACGKTFRAMRAAQGAVAWRRIASGLSQCPRRSGTMASCAGRQRMNCLSICWRSLTVMMTAHRRLAAATTIWRSVTATSLSS